MYCLPLGMATTSSELDRVAHSVVNTVSVHDVQETQASSLSVLNSTNLLLKNGIITIQSLSYEYKIHEPLPDD